MKRISVFCGSNPGARPEYAQAARELGRLLASRNIGLVFGGASVGMMAHLATAALEQGGQVTGVIPRHLVDREVAFAELDDLRIVDSMHQRKALIAELVDGFIALPGGLGTVEEFFEALTWAQLGLHQKPCGLLNVCGYYDRLVGFVDHAISQGFIEPEYRAMLLIDDSPEALLDRFETYQPPAIDKAERALQHRQHTADLPS
jgi:uncharacterized protein (TIGR00730 family)